VEDARATVHEVADEYRFSTKRMRVNRTAGKSRSTGRDRRDFVTQLTEQCFQFVAAAVYVPDDVERAVFVALVVVKRHALDRRGFHFLRTLQYENVPEALFGKTPHGPAQLRMLLANHVRAKCTFVSQSIALMADLFGHVQHHGDREAMVLSGEGNERPASFRL